MGNETFYWDGLKVASTLRPITAFLLAPFYGKGKNGEKQRQSASDASRIDPGYLSARVQFSRLYPHRGAWSQAKRHPTTVSSYTHFSREHFLGYPEY